MKTTYHPTTLVVVVVMVVVVVAAAIKEMMTKEICYVDGAGTEVVVVAVWGW